MFLYITYYDIPFLLQENDTSNLLESICSSSTNNKVRVNKKFTLTNDDILSKRSCDKITLMLIQFSIPNDRDV